MLSIIYAAREHPASLGEILMVGDYINHTGFTQEELDGGFQRLKAGDWIARSTNGISVTSKTSEAYAAISLEGLSAAGELKRLEDALEVLNAA